MHRNTFAFVIVAAIGGFVAGFWLANSLNRNAGTMVNSNSQLQATNTAGVPTNPPNSQLSVEEIRAKITEADKNPTNFAFQRDLGISLYRYAAMQSDEGLLAEAARILERADSLTPKDFDVLVALGNAHFDIGFFKEDAASFQKARDIYTKALAVRPADPDVATDRGLTYFLQKPPAYDIAATELSKVSDANPKHERSLQFLVQTYVRQNRLSDAEKAVAKLKGINPNNTAIPELTSMIAAQSAK